MRNYLMASIATKNKSKDRSKNEQFHFRQQKTKDKYDFVIHDIITQLQQVKAALEQATHERFSSRPHDEKFKQ